MFLSESHVKIITIPFEGLKKGFDESLLNDFVLNKRIVSSRVEFLWKVRRWRRLL